RTFYCTPKPPPHDSVTVAIRAKNAAQPFPRLRSSQRPEKRRISKGASSARTDRDYVRASVGKFRVGPSTSGGSASRKIAVRQDRQSRRNNSAYWRRSQRLQ